MFCFLHEVLLIRTTLINVLFYFIFCHVSRLTKKLLDYMENLFHSSMISPQSLQRIELKAMQGVTLEMMQNSICMIPLHAWMIMHILFHYHDDSFMPMDDHIDSPPPNSCDNCASSSIGRKRKNCVKEQNITAISAKFHHFVDLVGPGFKTLAECAVRDSEAKAYMVAARKEVDERKKLLNDVIFNIHGLTEDEALMVMQILRKDEEQLNMFWELPDERKLRFCRLLLGRMPNHPPM